MVSVVETEIKTKEVIMPRGDKTGPDGQGPMTGRRMGYCSGNKNPGFHGDHAGRGRCGKGMRTGNRGFGRGITK